MATYYEILEVNKEATASEIKKSYYKLAIRFHPDKNPNDPTAETKFKEISEAYEILSNEEKRVAYDKYGKSGLQGPDTFGIVEVVHSLFGDGAFVNYFGELTFGIMLDPKFVEMTEDQRTTALQRLQDEREAMLTATLVSRLEKFVKGLTDEWKADLLKETEELSQVPGGASLLFILGYVYKQEAQKKLGRFFGMESFMSKVRETTHALKGAVSASMAAVAMQAIMQEAERNGMLQSEEVQRKMMEKGIETIWRLGQLEIESVVRMVCEKVLKEPGLSKADLKKRALAIKQMGETFKTVGKTKKDNLVQDLKRRSIPVDTAH